MGALQDIAKEIAPLLRLQASDQPGEVSAAVAGIKRKLAAKGFDLNDFAVWIESAAAAAEPSIKRPTRAKASRPTDRDPPSHAPANDEVRAARWFELLGALWLNGQHRLGERDLQFLLNVWKRAQAGAAPSPGQQKWIADIQAKLAGREARAG
ncbi:MAG: hypothetical protein SGJ21_03225 [Alphaproteobacteria bacterium]|nr:hypothetical protein [Alphaproteobacteria bacterium]